MEVTKLKQADSFTLGISLCYFLQELAVSYKLEANEKICEVSFIKSNPLGFTEIKINHEKEIVSFHFTKVSSIDFFETAKLAFEKLAGRGELDIDEVNKTISNIDFIQAIRILKGITSFARSKNNDDNLPKVIDLSGEIPVGTKLQ